jgi:tol-pal system protein YbgF
MKKLIINLSVILAISPFLVHCASQNEVRDLQYQLRIVNKKLEDMKSNTVGMIQKRQADSSGQMSQLEQEIMTLKSQLGETNQLNSQLKEKNAELESAFTNYAQQESVKRDEALQRIEEEQKAKEAKLAELSEKVKVQQESVQAIQDARVREAERRAREAKLAADQAKARTQAAGSALASGSAGVVKIGASQQKKILSSSSPTELSSPPATSASPTGPAPSPAEESTPPTSSEKIEVASATSPAAAPAAAPAAPAAAAQGGGLTEAKNLYNSGKYQQAFALYEQYLRDNASGNEAIEARYMMGECLFQQKEFDQAILQYQKIIAQQAKHPKAASAMLRQAMAFEKLSDNETAKIIYQKILSSYGSSPEAAQAQEKLGKL